MHMNFPIRTREILRFCFLSFCVYALFIIFFAYCYYVTDSIALTPYAKPQTEKLDFAQSVYFSIVTFHTIGYGDIHPVTSLGQDTGNDSIGDLNFFHSNVFRSAGLFCYQTSERYLFNKENLYTSQE